MCDNCHGPDAEGGFGPDLAGGRGRSLDQLRWTIRRPWEVMPTFNEDQLSDQWVADVHAFVGTKPRVPEPGGWYWRRAPETAPVVFGITLPPVSVARGARRLLVQLGVLPLEFPRCACPANPALAGAPQNRPVRRSREPRPTYRPVPAKPRRSSPSSPPLPSPRPD